MQDERKRCLSFPKQNLGKKRRLGGVPETIRRLLTTRTIVTVSAIRIELRAISVIIWKHRVHVLTTLIIQRLPCFVSGFLKRVFIKMFSIVFLCSCLAFLLKQMEQSLSSEGKSPLHFSINSTSIKPHWIPHAQVSFASQCEYFSPIN